MIFEDGQGNFFQEDGVTPMELSEKDDTPFGLETLATMSDYAKEEAYKVVEDKEDKGLSTVKKNNSPGISKDGISKHVYSDKVREQFFELKAEKLLSSRAAALQLGINPRTAQKWAKTYKEGGYETFPSPKKYQRGRKPILQDEHKAHLIEFIDENPSAAVDQMVDSLTRSFEGLEIKKSAVHKFVVTECNISFKMVRKEAVERNSESNVMKRLEWIKTWEKTTMDFMTNCVFIDEAGFHVNMKRSQGWAAKGETPVVITPSTRAVSTSIIGAICGEGVVNLSLRKPKAPVRSKKRKTVTGAAENPIHTYKGTVTGHYLQFLSDTMIELDKFEQWKGCYLVMDNASNHKNIAIANMITERGYRYIYLPPYSPELNPIEQFWSVLKSKLKRSKLLEKETLSLRIKEASREIELSSIQGFIGHSMKRFDDCRNMNPI